MYCKRYNAPDLRAAGIFNLSVIPDWETIGSARRHLSSLDHFSEEVNPQDFNCSPGMVGIHPVSKKCERHDYQYGYRVYYYLHYPLITNTGTVTVTLSDCLAHHRQQ